MKKMQPSVLKRLVVYLLSVFPSIFLFAVLFRPGPKKLNGGLDKLQEKYRFNDNGERTHLDLGCGAEPRNSFDASTVLGLDLVENIEKGVRKCHLGFESIPFDDCSIDYLTAFDVLEHIPRFAILPAQNNAPFIFFMNECYRVLKPGGIFLSSTPIFPYPAAFQDPTHNNIMTKDTLAFYFSDNKLHVASHYGINTNFKILDQAMMGQNLVAVLSK